MDGLHQPFRNILSNLRQRTLDLPRGESRNFARCLLVKTAQWAFDGKEHLPTPTAFVGQISLFFDEMKRGMQDYSLALRAHGNDKRTLSERRWLLQCSAKNLAVAARDISQRAALVVTSPPYLGVHVLYNKWQLEGRRELRAPFFLVDQHDIGGAANYTIIDRKTKTHTLYYSEIEQSFRAVRTLLKPKAYVIQLVSFGEAESALPHYLSALNRSGLELCETYMRAGLQWRFVPGRRWYARVREVENSSANREVLLVHRKGGSE
ncbi:hypothetical protein [Dokdonella sp.]|uniref:hypothetical protein n=1 Tax=Dokdonella sp. TaxID=2291710 RepID=UPI003784150A